ncbi:hypothetical protein, partial [Sutterella sp.]|uniref:hypothetical protein n=1 Tax=Sutterella sp. TaxID=1981025 RepID=UPI0026DFCDAA
MIKQLAFAVTVALGAAFTAPAFAAPDPDRPPMVQKDSKDAKKAAKEREKDIRKAEKERAKDMKDRQKERAK